MKNETTKKARKTKIVRACPCVMFEVDEESGEEDFACYSCGHPSEEHQVTQPRKCTVEVLR